MGDSLVERVGRAIAAADMEDFMEDFQRYEARARAAIALVVEEAARVAGEHTGHEFNPARVIAHRIRLLAQDDEAAPKPPAGA